MRQNDWNPEAVERFWNYYANDPRNADNYFAKKFGTAIVSILQTVSREGRVLDLGCGLGFLSERLLRAGFSVQGVDQSRESIDAANARCRDVPNWLGAFTDTRQLASSSFDVVTCIETIEHLDDRTLGDVLADIRRLLRPGGIALFTTPNDEDLTASMAYCPFCDSEFHAMQHVRSWSDRSLAPVLEQAGFEIRRCAPTNLAWWMPFRESQWVGARRSAVDLVDRARHRKDRWRTGAHLVALAASR